MQALGKKWQHLSHEIPSKIKIEKIIEKESNTFYEHWIERFLQNFSRIVTEPIKQTFESDFVCAYVICYSQ